MNRFTAACGAAVLSAVCANAFANCPTVAPLPPVTLAFNDLAFGTPVSNQYASQGSEYSTPTAGVYPIEGLGALLSGKINEQIDNTNIGVNFVMPDTLPDGVTHIPAMADAVSLDASGAIGYTVYIFDSNGQIDQPIITAGPGSSYEEDCSASIQATGYCHITVPSTSVDQLTTQIVNGARSIIVAQGGATQNLVITNLSYEILPPSLYILKPVALQAFPTTDEDYAAADFVAFQANDQQNPSTPVTFTLTLDYATVGGNGKTEVPYTLTSTTNTATSFSFQKVGGQLTIRANEQNGIEACPVTYAYVIGPPTPPGIPDAEITARLGGLYSGVTQNLLTGIAEAESTYAQFWPEINFSYNGMWPHESRNKDNTDFGSHIGLMMMPTTMSDAWDWHANTADGAALFQLKLSSAKTKEQEIMAANKGLHKLKPLQLEQMAVLLYGPYANADIKMQYWAAAPDPDGHGYIWVINTANNKNGVDYTDQVYSGIKH